MMKELRWVAKARSYLGLKEIVGAKHNPTVVDMWKLGFNATGQSHRLKESVWQNDETPWCGAFCAAVLAQSNLSHRIPKSFPLARAWSNVGTKLTKPAYGCIVVFSRGGGGHVGFVVGKDKKGNLMVLGGNQSNQVSIVPFSVSRVLAYRWVGDGTAPSVSRYSLPILASNGKVSTNEA